MGAGHRYGSYDPTLPVLRVLPKGFFITVALALALALAVALSLAVALLVDLFGVL